MNCSNKGVVYKDFPANKILKPNLHGMKITGANLVYANVVTTVGECYYDIKLDERSVEALIKEGKTRTAICERDEWFVHVNAQVATGRVECYRHQTSSKIRWNYHGLEEELHPEIKKIIEGIFNKLDSDLCEAEWSIAVDFISQSSQSNERLEPHQDGGSSRIQDQDFQWVLRYHNDDILFFTILENKGYEGGAMRLYESKFGDLSYSQMGGHLFSQESSKSLRPIKSFPREAGNGYVIYQNYYAKEPFTDTPGSDLKVVLHGCDSYKARQSEESTASMLCIRVSMCLLHREEVFKNAVPFSALARNPEPVIEKTKDLPEVKDIPKVAVEKASSNKIWIKILILFVLASAFLIQHFYRKNVE